MGMRSRRGTTSLSTTHTDSLSPSQQQTSEAAQGSSLPRTLLCTPTTFVYLHLKAKACGSGIAEGQNRVTLALNPST